MILKSFPSQDLSDVVRKKYNNRYYSVKTVKSMVTYEVCEMKLKNIGFKNIQRQLKLI